jgi:hypothetical protein
MMTSQNPKMKQMLFRRLIFCFALMGLAISFNAQTNYTRTCGGFNYVMPKLGKGYDGEAMRGINVRNKFIEMGYYAGRVTSSLDSNLLAYNGFIGLNLPIRLLGFGKREYGIKGALVAPYVAVDLCRMGIGTNHTWGATVAPGISLQLPYVLVDFRLNTVIGFKNVPGLKRERYMFAPTIQLQFDGLWDVMNPKVEFDHTYNGAYTWTESKDFGNYTEYTTYYEEYSEDIYRYNVGAHISIGPRLCNWNLKNGNNSTFMYGLVQSGRANSFGYDLIAEQGKITTTDGQQIKALRSMARLSMNLNFSGGGNTFFTRLMVGGGIGYNWFTSDNAYVHAENGEFFNLFISMEFGAVAFSYEVNKAFYNKYDDQKYFAFTYRIPIERVIYRYRQLKESK